MSEWTVVTSQDKRRVIRSGGGPKRLPALQNILTEDGTWTEETKSAIIHTLSQCRSELFKTRFYHTLRSSVIMDSNMKQIVCYGIGNLSTRPCASMWQLACALNIRDEIESTEMLFFDPCTTAFEAQLMASEWNIRVITENERGKRCVNGLSTLFFMPHCPLRLYDNVLWANWNELEHVILFGNSLSAYSDRTMKPLPKGISLLLPFLKQEHVDIPKSDLKETTGNFEGAFNDCYLTWVSADERGGMVLPPRPEESIDDGDEVV